MRENDTLSLFRVTFVSELHLTESTKGSILDSFTPRKADLRIHPSQEPGGKVWFFRTALAIPSSLLRLAAAQRIYFE